MRRVFKTRNFARWLRKTELRDQTLCEAVDEMGRGLVDADLGGGVVKKRVALPGRGKSGSARTLIATNRGDRWFFIFGFEKNERDNITVGELGALKKVAADLLPRSSEALKTLLTAGELQEICHEYQAQG